jgi:hypothetical protein
MIAIFSIFSFPSAYTQHRGTENTEDAEIIF